METGVFGRNNKSYLYTIGVRMVCETIERYEEYKSLLNYRVVKHFHGEFEDIIKNLTVKNIKDVERLRVILLSHLETVVNTNDKEVISSFAYNLKSALSISKLTTNK